MRIVFEPSWVSPVLWFRGGQCEAGRLLIGDIYTRLSDGCSSAETSTKQHNSHPFDSAWLQKNSFCSYGLNQENKTLRNTLLQRNNCWEIRPFQGSGHQ